MNEAPKRTAFKEGFVEETAKPEPKLPPTAPPPEMLASPAENEDMSAIIAAEEKWPIVVPLRHKPIRNDRGDLVHELSFREPRGGDINRFGNPTRLVSDQEGSLQIIVDERKMHYIMAALCGIMVPMLDAMDPRDWNNCCYRLRGFFLPDLGA
jgi:hypothetical protein